MNLLHDKAENCSIYAAREKEGAQLKWVWEHAFRWNSKKKKNSIIHLLPQYMRCKTISTSHPLYEQITARFAQITSSPFGTDEPVYLFLFPYQAHCDFNGKDEYDNLEKETWFCFLKKRKQTMLHISMNCT